MLTPRTKEALERKHGFDEPPHEDINYERIQQEASHEAKLRSALKHLNPKDPRHLYHFEIHRQALFENPHALERLEPEMHAKMIEYYEREWPTPEHWLNPKPGMQRAMQEA